MFNPPSKSLQQTVYIHRAVQKSIAQKKSSSYVPVADGFITTSGSGHVSGSGSGHVSIPQPVQNLYTASVQPIQKIESLQK
jgi:hypothetical protein